MGKALKREKDGTGTGTANNETAAKAAEASVENLQKVAGETSEYGAGDVYLAPLSSVWYETDKSAVDYDPRVERELSDTFVDGIAAEPGDEPVEFGGSGGRTLCGQRLPDSALAASGENRPVRIGGSSGPFRKVIQVVERAALLPTCQLSMRDRCGKTVVSLLPAGEHEQVGAGGVGLPGLWSG